MSLIKWSPSTNKFKHEKIGNLESTCPHCGQVLVKRPSRKTKCPHCGNYVFVRTRPADGEKVLVTEEQASQIDIQWMKENGDYDAYLEEQAKFQKTKERLSLKFGKEASDRDVYWAIFNERLILHSKQGNWGLFRNTRFEMAELLRKEGQNYAALVTYIEVSYLDANGPRNLSGVTDPKILRDFPPFDSKLAFQAPAIVHTIDKLSTALNLDQLGLKAKFIEVAAEIQTRMKLTVSPEEAWHEYIKALKK